MKRFILVLLLVLSASGLFAESIYSRKHIFGDISLVKENKTYILTTNEIKDDGFVYRTIIEIKYEIMSQEFIYALETNCKNGNYYDFIHSAYEEGNDDLELIGSNCYFKDNNMVIETKYKCDAE